MSFAGDVYCALCGVVFSVYAELYGGRLRWEEVDWTSYYQLCTYLGKLYSEEILRFTLVRHKDQGTQNADSNSNRSWYLSGVGEIVGAMGWEFRTPIPSLDEDMRRQERTDINRAHDNVVAYKSRYVFDKNTSFPTHGD
jgi:hypothetical protein